MSDPGYLDDLKAFDDIGGGEEEEDVPDQEEVDPGYEGLLQGFDSADLASGARIRDTYSVEERLTAYYVRTTGKPSCPFTQGSPTVNALFEFCGIIAGLRSGVASDEFVTPALFSVSGDRVRALLANATIGSIKASLCSPRTKAQSFVTPISACRLVPSLVGVRATMEVGADDKIESWVATAPGLPAIKIRASGADFPYVIEGGTQFFEAYNSVYKTNFTFLDLNEIECKVAVMLASMITVRGVDGRVECKQVVRAQDVYQLGLVPDPNGIEAWLSSFISVVEAMARKRDLQMPSGFPTKDQVSVMEYVLFRMRTVLKDGYARMISVIEKLYPKRVANYQLVIDKMTAAVIANPKLATPFIKHEGPEVLKGDVCAYRKSHETIRAGLRADIRKGDSVDGSGFGHSCTSIPYKIQACARRLALLVPRPPEKVHAFGTGHENRWVPTLNVAYNRANVSYFDVERIGEAQFATVVSRMDVTKLAEGFGAGCLIADDSSPDDPDSKVESIIRAGYECGFFKYMYGWGAQAKAVTTNVSTSLEKLRREYGYVEFFNFNPHSEEMFVVFGKAVTKWPKYNVLQSAVEPGQGDTVALWLVQARAWMRIHAVRMYVANIRKTAQARSGVRGLTLNDGVVWWRGDPILPRGAILSCGGTSTGGKVRNSPPEGPAPAVEQELDEINF